MIKINLIIIIKQLTIVQSFISIYISLSSFIVHGITDMDSLSLCCSRRAGVNRRNHETYWRCPSSLDCVQTARNLIICFSHNAICGHSPLCEAGPLHVDHELDIQDYSRIQTLAVRRWRTPTQETTASFASIGVTLLLHQRPKTFFVSNHCYR